MPIRRSGLPKTLAPFLQKKTALSTPVGRLGLPTNQGRLFMKNTWPTLEDFLLFCGFLVISWPFLGSGGVLKWSWDIGLSPVLIWAHTEPYGPISDKKSFFWIKKNLRSWSRNLDFLKCKSHHLAILINIWHIWEDRSRKVNNDEPDLRFFHGNLWPVISRTVRKPCPRGGVWVLP